MAAWNFIGPIVVSGVVTDGGSCDVARLLLGLNESTSFLLSQKCIRRQCFLKGKLWLSLIYVPSCWVTATVRFTPLGCH